MDSVEQEKVDLMEAYNLTESMVKVKCSKDHSLEVEKFISWRYVGPHLDKIETHDIKDIDEDGYDQADKRRMLVYLWHERCGDNATYDALITAMLKAGRKNEATDICNLLQPPVLCE